MNVSNWKSFYWQNSTIFELNSKQSSYKNLNQLLQKILLMMTNAPMGLVEKLSSEMRSWFPDTSQIRLNFFADECTILCIVFL
jgi:hypothetical protein